MITIIDPGHKYRLLSLDGDKYQELTFVKRCDLENPNRFPGNYTSYPGTTLQSVIRCLLDRMIYLQGQIYSIENVIIIYCLKMSLWLLEFRAARRHKKWYWHGLNFAATKSMCFTCGHTICEHQD